MTGEPQVFDYVVVGSGSAGSIVASRLSENGRHSVCVVEAGGSDRSIWLKIPIGYARSYYDPAVNWMYRTEPEPELGGRRIYAPRGKVRGGSGAINAMIFVRGAASDFDGWRAAGNPGWAYEDVLPVFRRMERHADGASAFHGDAGPIGVTPMRGAAHPICDAFLKACAELQLPATPDFNGAAIEGAGIYDVNTRRGLRSSSGAEYLRPALRRSHVRIIDRARATRIVLDAERRATGVKITRDGRRSLVEARREVILCAGAVDTPKLLQLSGIGDGAMLAGKGIETRHHLPAVGRNLQDHLCASLYYRSTVPTLNGEVSTLVGQARLALRYLLTRKGPFAMSVNQAGGFFRGRPSEPRENIQLYFNPLSYRIPDNPKAGLKAEPYPGFLLAFNACRPTSRGTVEIASADAASPPEIRPNYLSTTIDRDEAIQGIRLARRIMEMPALRAITAEEMPPSAGACAEDELLAYVREHSGSIYHLCGSAAMGPDPATSAVDARLRVHGVAALRVVDASIFPTITAGNINAPTMMVAEKGASMILEGP